MAVKAYILIESSIGKVEDVLAEIRKLPQVLEVNAVAGPYDIIAVLEAEQPEVIGRLVMERLHHIPGINYTMTCLAITG
ncbi:MAG: Lrp/AsnC ligand binding domain-containing protein [Chloroflexia bacterium]|nr:Lrp/AsnC ligand binding domain-containing protein [Chloroflexia bacterium]